MRPWRRKLLRTRVIMPLVVALVVVFQYWHPWRRPVTIVVGTNPRDGAAMVWVPAGTFRMGTSNSTVYRVIASLHRWADLRKVVEACVRGTWDFNEQPVHTVYLDGYWIYKYEVTVAQYRAFCQARNAKCRRRLPGDGAQITR